jgi:hypothetical protein
MIDDNQPNRDCIPVPIKQLLDDKASRDLVNAQFKALGERISYESEARQKAVDKAEESTRVALQKAEFDNQNRFTNVNEWRASMKDLQSNFVQRSELKTIEEKVGSHISRAEHEALIKQFETKIEKAQGDLDNQIATLNAKVDRKDDQRYVTWGGIIITLLIAGAALLGIKI